MARYKRKVDPSVAPGTRAHCEGCGRPASYMVNSTLWRLKERDVCPLCEATGNVDLQKPVNN